MCYRAVASQLLGQITFWWTANKWGHTCIFFYLFIFNLWVKTVLIKARNSALVLAKHYHILCNELCTLVSFSVVHLIFLGFTWGTSLLKYLCSLYSLNFCYKPAFDCSSIVDALSFQCALLLWKWACCLFWFVCLLVSLLCFDK